MYYLRSNLPDRKGAGEDLSAEGIDAELKEVGRGALFAMGGQLLRGVTLYLCSVLIGRSLGEGGLGNFSTGKTLVSALGLVACFGLTSALVRFGAQYRRAGDAARLRGLFGGSFATGFLVGCFLGGLVYVFAPFLSSGFAKGSDLVVPLRMFAAVLPVLCVMMLSWEALRGVHAVGSRVLCESVVRPGTMLLLLGVFVAGGMTLKRAVTAYGLSVGAAVVVALPLLWLASRLVRERVKPVFEARKAFRFSVPMLFSQVVGNVAAWADTFMIAGFKGPAEVGVFNAAGLNSSMGSMTFVSFNMLFAPIVAAQHHAGELDRMRALIRVVTRWGITVSLPVFLLIVVFPGDVMGLFGPGFQRGSVVILLLVFSAIVNAATGPVMSILAMAGRQDTVLADTVAVAAVKVALNFVMIPRYGAAGAAGATLVCAVAINGIMLLQIYRGLGVHPFSGAYLKPLVAGALGYGAAVWALGAGWWAGGLLHYAVPGGVMIVVYSGALLALGFREEDRMIARAVMNKLRKQ